MVPGGRCREISRVRWILAEWTFSWMFRKGRQLGELTPPKMHTGRVEDMPGDTGVLWRDPKLASSRLTRRWGPKGLGRGGAQVGPCLGATVREEVTTADPGGTSQASHAPHPLDRAGREERRPLLQE